MDNGDVFSEFKNLESLSLSMPDSEVPIFQRISELDQKFSNDDYYNLNIEGVIGNIANLRGSEKLINYAICQLKKRIKNFNNNGIFQDKFHYDLGTLLQGKADLLNRYPHEFSKLLERKEYSEARNYYNKVDEMNYSLAHTNQANILDYHGRNFEAILLYDKVLNRDPEFGMALGNKAKALIYYYNLSPKKNNQILKIAEDLLKKSLEDSRLLEIGGQEAVDEFNKELLEQIPLLLKQNNKAKVKNFTLPVSYYEKFISENNLYLNFDFGLFLDKHSIEDSLFPSLLYKINGMNHEDVKMKTFSEKVIHSIKIFNQIKEDFTSTRFLFYEWMKKDIFSQDKNVLWVYAFDFSRNSIKHGVLKMILANLYNILDKIARCIMTYFEIKLPSDDIYLKDLESIDFKDLIIKNKNYQLLALHELSKDFNQNKVYSKFKELRNKLTHSSIDIFELPEKEGDLTLELLNENILEFFLIVKSAILYASLGIDEEVKMKSKENINIPIYTTKQKAKWHSDVSFHPSDIEGIIKKYAGKKGVK